MPDLLLELLSEEIPARMQRGAADDLRRLVTDALVAQGFVYEGAKAFATPRRLALHVAGLPAKGRDVREERKGPRVGAPEAALQGFLRSAGVASVDALEIQSDPKKGEFYIARIEKPGRPTEEVIAEILPQIIRSFPWPKSMRWGAASAEPGALRWVRPLQSILCTFGPETETPEVVAFEIDGIRSGDVTSGHRFLAPGAIQVRRFEDYEAALGKAKVVLDAGRRADIIRHDARDLAFAQGLEVVEDEALLAEVSGLVEWPVVLMGAFDEAFLAIPPEVIRTTIRANQKCFVLRPQGGGGQSLAKRFILVSNIQARDDGAAIVAGNERVVRARLSDARFFWESDLKVPLEERLPKLKSIIFHEKLGTQHERVERIAALARHLAPLVGADPDLAGRAARLAKADLVSEMVGEFPELQGLMGRYYAQAQGEDPAIAAALEEHYKPVGPSDGVPENPVSVAVALADKLDTLVGFWAIDEKPTGSKDPYALRRAALGIIRLVLERGHRLALTHLFATALHRYRLTSGASARLTDDGALEVESDLMLGTSAIDRTRERLPDQPLDGFEDEFRDVAHGHRARFQDSVQRDLLSFFHDRLKVYLRDQGARHDLIDAVLSAEGATVNDDLLMVVRRVEALGRLLASEDGRNLLAGFKRAANILRIEEKKDGRTYDAEPDRSLVEARGLPEERALLDALADAERAAREGIAREDFEGAMRALAALRPAVDAFFDKVTVNVDDAGLRQNRLQLLNGLRRATREVADFARIEG